MKNVLAVICGVIAGVAIVFTGDSITHAAYPPPASLNANDNAQINAYVSSAPFHIMLAMIIFWLLSSFIGGLTAALINRQQHKKVSTITGSILLAAAIINMMIIPHPLWMWAISALLYIPVARTGGNIVGRERREEGDLPQ
jgi:hypothetical protein